ncbi:hypothetical protein [Bacillus atrophaeus]|uniref:hypothetical protein n=1 Tax=Bacillus atrophaeus TaxID=1452 RepID=UPI003F59ED23
MLDVNGESIEQMLLCGIFLSSGSFIALLQAAYCHYVWLHDLMIKYSINTSSLHPYKP